MVRMGQSHVSKMRAGVGPAGCVPGNRVLAGRGAGRDCPASQGRGGDHGQRAVHAACPGTPAARWA